VLRVGLTGGIGSGKSTVARLLAGHGARIIDADALAREALAPGGPGVAAVAAAFPGVVNDEGVVDRGELARRVFSDLEARTLLESIVHPIVATFTAAEFEAAGDDDIVVNDVPLLVEAGLGHRFDVVVVVACPEQVRLGRLVARGLTEADARARIAAQASESERRAVADLVVDNTGDLAELERSVADLWQTLSARATRS
jgi:dephospho-CoA kinase